MQVIGVNHILVSFKLMPFLYADLSFLYMSKIGPDRGFMLT